MEIPTGLSNAENPTNAQQQINLLQEYERKFEHLSEERKLTKWCCGAGLKLVEQGHYFHTLDTEEGPEMQHLCREYTMLRNEKKTRARGWILKNTVVGPVLDTKVCYHDDRYHLCFKTEPLLGLESWMVLISTWQNRCWPRKKRT